MYLYLFIYIYIKYIYYIYYNKYTFATYPEFGLRSDWSHLPCDGKQQASLRELWWVSNGSAEKFSSGPPWGPT